jgi:hypothetical protein
MAHEPTAVLHFVQDTRIGGLIRYRLLADPGEVMRVPDEIRQCVAFLWYQGKAGSRLAGTAFFVDLAADNFPPVSWVYLVTARHVIDQIKNHSLDQVVRIRMNDHNGGSVSVESNASVWLSHATDRGVDVAVLPYAPGHDLVEYKRFPYTAFVDSELITEENVGVGDDLCLTGLFVNHFGKHRNLPIVRVGNIAAMPEEPIQTKGGPIEGIFDRGSLNWGT